MSKGLLPVDVVRKRRVEASQHKRLRQGCDHVSHVTTIININIIITTTMTRTSSMKHRDKIAVQHVPSTHRQSGKKRKDFWTRPRDGPSPPHSAIPTSTTPHRLSTPPIVLIPHHDKTALCCAPTTSCRRVARPKDDTRMIRSIDTRVPRVS